MSRQEQIIRLLQQALHPVFLDVLDESWMHAHGHESHYRVTVVSPAFAGLAAVRRHQQVYAVLGTLMGSLRALAIHALTPEEWQARGSRIPASPACTGGGQPAGAHS